MSKMAELEYNKRLNSFKSFKTSDSNLKSPLQRKRIDVQPIVHNKHKIVVSKCKDTQQLLKKNEQPSCSSLNKKPLKACELKNQTIFSEIKSSQIETMTENDSVKKSAESFQQVGLYEIKSYQLVEVSKKQAELTSINKSSIHNMDMSRKTAKKAAKFFHLAKVHKGKPLSNPYMKFVHKVTRKPLKAGTKSKLPTLENGELLQEMLNYTGIGVSTQTEKGFSLVKTFNELIKKNSMVAVVLLLMVFNILLWFMVGHDNNCEEVGQFNFAHAIYRFCKGS